MPRRTKVSIRTFRFSRDLRCELCYYRPYPPNYKIVSKRARQFEKGQPQPEDDAVATDRTSFYRSELENMSSKILVPNVAVRTREFETRSSEPRHDGSSGLVTSSSNNNNSILKKSRDSRSLESSGECASDEVIDFINSRNTLTFGVFIIDILHEMNVLL